MNATPTHLTPGNTVQGSPAAGKPGDSSTADLPFSQVLTGEITRQGNVREGAEPGSGKLARKAGDDQEGIEAVGADIAQQLAGALEAVGTLIPPAATETGADPAAATGESPSDAQASGSATPPAVLLGLPVVAPDSARAAPAAAAVTAAAQPEGLAVSLDAGGNRHATAAENALSRTLPAQPDTATVTPTASTVTPAAAAATAFSERLAASQPESAQGAERVAELMSQPGVRGAAHPAAAAVPTAADPASTRLAPAVGTPAWGQALGDKLVWMASGTQQTASLTLNPPNLGPLQVVLDVRNDQATASFYAAQPEVRQALEAALPRLREMMTDAGIQLGQATVSADTPRQNDTPDRQAQRIAPEFLGAGSAAPSAVEQTELAGPVARTGRGLVDTFA